MFTLLARDPESPDLVEEWADREEFKKGVTPKVLEARECAQAMRRWAARRR